MSLQVWLPLNGNINNYGLSGTKATNNGATIENIGKIGKCYSFDGTDDYMSIPFSDFGNNFSISLWFNRSSSAVWIFCTRVVSYGGIGIYVSDSTNKLTIDCASSAESSSRWETSTVISDNTWYHLTVVRDEQKISYYINGSFIEEKQIAYVENFGPIITIGARNTNGTQIASYASYKFNDIRIYDHCLSAKEVKELSKGLFLHYKFDEVEYIDDEYETLEYIQSTGTQWIDLGMPVGSYDNVDIKLAFHESITAFFGASDSGTYNNKTFNGTVTSGTTFVFYTSFDESGTYRSTYSASLDTIYDIKWNGTPYSVFTANGATSTQSGTPGNHLYTPKINAYLFCRNNNSVAYGGQKMILYAFSVENKMKLVPARHKTSGVVGLYDTLNRRFLTNQGDGDDFIAGPVVYKMDNTIIHDSSGYSNNGLVIGHSTSTEIIPRYKYALKMNNRSTACHIETSAIPCDDNMFSVSMWVKCAKTTNQVLLADPKIQIGILNSLITVSPSSAKQFNMTSFITNEWNHIVAIRNGSSYSLYINGQTQTLSSTSNVYTHNKTQLWLLNRSYNNNYAANAYISDVRIYATILSIDDIKELYDTGAFIDNLGNASCYEFEEQNENLLKYENTLLHTRNNTSTANTRGKHTYKNGVLAMAFQAIDTYFGSGDQRNNMLLHGFFKENTQYLFDLWIDADNVISGGVNRVAGFTVKYSDGINSTSLNVTGSTNPLKGWQHKVFVSAKNKSISSLTIPYYTSAVFYVRADSFITEINSTDIKPNGVINTSQVIENTDVAFIGRGDVNANKLLEI